MSEENVEVVRGYDQAVKELRGVLGRSRPRGGGAGDGRSPRSGRRDAPLHAPEWEWNTAHTGTTYRGYNGLARGFDQTVDAAQNYGIEIHEVSELGGDKVLAVVKAAMRGRATDIDVNAGIYVVVTVGNGLITRWTNTWTEPTRSKPPGCPNSGLGRAGVVLTARYSKACRSWQRSGSTALIARAFWLC